MVDLLINSERDITLLTCEECALEIYEELVACDCKFIQSKRSIEKELNSGSGVIEITKLVAEGNKEDLYFVFVLEDEGLLRDKIVMIDSCVEWEVWADNIPSSCEINYVDEKCCFDITELKPKESDKISSFVRSLLNSWIEEDDEEYEECYDEYDEYDEYDDEVCCDDICDECLAVNEIMDIEDITLEESLRLAYRFGKEAMLVEMEEFINYMLYK